MIYLQGNNGLIPLEQELSKKKIIQLLGFTPASEDQVINLKDYVNEKFSAITAITPEQIADVCGMTVYNARRAVL